jgi:DNA polymerase IV
VFGGIASVGVACERVFVSGEPTILHADLDAFYASVEQRDDPALRGRPVIVGGGVVLACSYEAKARGVRTAMGGRMARALCPDAVVVPPRMEAYTGASRAVFSVFHSVTPLVEGISIDEAFLDVSGLRRIAGPPPEIAARLRREVADDVGLPITVGVASTKFLAKVASRVAKPDGLLVVPVGGELEFLHPLAVEVLWGVGEVTSRKLRGQGITTVGDLAAMGGPGLESLLGKAAGRHLDALAHGRDPRRVQVGRRRRSVGAQRALGREPVSPARTDAVLMGLVDRVTRRMRRAGRTGRTVTPVTRTIRDTAHGPELVGVGATATSGSVEVSVDTIRACHRRRRPAEPHEPQKRWSRLRQSVWMSTVEFMPGMRSSPRGSSTTIFTGITWVTFWKFPELLDWGSGEKTPAAPPWISRTEPVRFTPG